MEIGLRVDYILDYGVVILLWVFVYFKIMDKFLFWFGGGFGYKLFIIFIEDSERL